MPLVPHAWELLLVPGGLLRASMGSTITSEKGSPLPGHPDLPQEGRRTHEPAGGPSYDTTAPVYSASRAFVWNGQP